LHNNVANQEQSFFSITMPQRPPPPQDAFFATEASSTGNFIYRSYSSTIGFCAIIEEEPDWADSAHSILSDIFLRSKGDEHFFHNFKAR
jgi:hypothetical protein